MKIRVVTLVAISLFSPVICRSIWAADSVGQSESERLKNLEDAVRQLQQRNSDLEREVKQLKSRNTPFAPVLSGPE
jgi:cell division protein FtsB